MRVLAIDPGYERVGVAVVEKTTASKETLLYSDCFKTSNKESFHTRLGLIGEELSKLIQTYRPTSLAIETLFFNTNQKTALNVAEVRGMILYLAVLNKLSIYEYNPLQVKNATVGYGKATKEQVAQMVKKLVVIEKEITLDDEYDAIAIALTCCASERD